MANTPNKSIHYCSFCGRSEKAVQFLIPAPTGAAFICDVCIEDCNDLIQDAIEEQHFEKLSMEELPRPIQIKESLDRFVIGQDEAKIALSVAVYNHYKRILSKDNAKKAKGKKKKAPAEQVEESEDTDRKSVV